MIFKRLMAKLFGWHYVCLSFGFSNIVRRRHMTPDGTPYVIAYGLIVFDDAHHNFKVLF